MKTKLFLRLASALTLLLVSVAQAAPSAEPSKEDPKAEVKAGSQVKASKRDAYPLWGEVVAVTAKTLTIKGGEGKENRNYAITADTKIHNNSEAAKIEDIQVGKKVGGRIKKVEGGDDQMISINIGVKQERTEAAGSKEGETKAKAKKKGAE